ncbi:WGR domain-containing protein [Rhizobium terrae]|uniref:WGR domain-containing protein n=1 Tax=Rhizobium terrae TaxID=2171756 RepID=UPI001D0092B5|nr:WGR domain-containing protein [Rhizobium terrae]
MAKHHERTDSLNSIARFYTVAILETLLGEPCLIRRWGRIGASRQSMVHAFSKEEDTVGCSSRSSKESVRAVSPEVGHSMSNFLISRFPWQFLQWL